MKRYAKNAEMTLDDGEMRRIHNGGPAGNAKRATIKFGNNHINSSLFADDTALLCKTTADLKVAISLIDKFTATSGLQLNINKSTCICAQAQTAHPFQDLQGRTIPRIHD
jgi:sensor c-di-GMP phosphodiesterase-like protein